VLGGHLGDAGGLGDAAGGDLGQASVEELVTVAVSPTTRSTSAMNSSRGSASWRASSLATGAATISSSVATATPGASTSHRGW
jgi:hypothetical protein